MKLYCDKSVLIVTFTLFVLLLTACGGGASAPTQMPQISSSISANNPPAGSLLSSSVGDGSISSVNTSASQIEISSAPSSVVPVSASSNSSLNLSLKSSSFSSSSRSSQIYIGGDAMYRQVSVADAVVGFENIDAWSVVGGDKSIVRFISEGQSALKIENAQAFTLTSQPINTLRGIGDQLSIDVMSVENIIANFSLKLSIPSRGIYQALLPLEGAPELLSGIKTSLTFRIPDSVKAQLNAEYDDLQFELAVASANPLIGLVFDNLVFSQSMPMMADKVEIELQEPDDFVYLMVNGIQRKVWANHIYGNISTGRIDISSMFWKGVNTVRLQGINSGSLHKLIFTLWINGEKVIHKNCPPQTCGYLFDQGIFYDSVFVFNTPNLAEAAVVNLVSPAGANIYVDDLFINRQVPVQLRLPPKNFRIGAGTFSDAPFNYLSQFYEREVHLVSGDQQIELTSADKLGVQHTTRVAIVPIRHTKVSGFSRTGVLTDEGVEFFRKNIQMANDKWIVPLSYGLQQWDIKVLPMVDNITLELPELLAGFSVGDMLSRAGLDAIKSQYEIIIVHYSGYDENNLRIDNGGGAGASAGSGYIIIPNVWPFESHRPHGVILHEALHVYEQAQRNLQYLYNGANGLHGAEVHGYTPNSNLGEEDWVGWYRMFIRNAAKETIQMRDLQFRYVPSEDVDVQVGVFDTMRHGLGFLH